MTVRAYSYVRFSTAEQLKGKSLERQTEAAATWCAQNAAELDTQLSLKDLGVSAFRGKNASVGALSIFLARVADGTVPRGSFLLIEAFDRMSRDTAYDAQLTLQNIIHAGITVVTLLNGKKYSVDILRSDPFALIYAIVEMTRGHEESSTKSRRVADAWARKRADIKNGTTLTATTPKWIRLNAQRKPELIASRAKLIREMFESAAAGEGGNAIAAELNNRKIATWSKSKFWHDSYIKRILRNRSVLGEFRTFKSEMHGQSRVRVSAGPPIKDYWPVIVSETLFDRVQQIINSRVVRHGPRNKIRSLLAGLARCPLCGSSMERKMRKQKGQFRYYCYAARVHKCVYRSVNLHDVDAALVAAADTLYDELPPVDPALRVKVAQVELALVETDKKLYDMGVLLDDDSPPKTIVERIRKLELAKSELTATVEALKSQLVLSEPQYIRDRAKKLRDALSWHAADPSDVASVNQVLRECFAKVVINYNSSTLECVWKHGPMSIIAYPK